MGNNFLNKKNFTDELIDSISPILRATVPEDAAKKAEPTPPLCGLADNLRQVKSKIFRHITLIKRITDRVEA